MTDLTSEQIKNLEIFTRYCRAYGADMVTKNIIILNYSIDYMDHIWYKDTGGTLDGYEIIEDTILQIIDSNNLELQGNRDYDSLGYLLVKINCIDKYIEIIATEWQPTANESSESKYISNITNKSVKELIKYIKDKGYSHGHVEFEGSGDEGEISNNIKFVEEETIEINSEVQTFLYQWLESYYSGWENNEGSYGDFIFYDDGTITLDFKSRDKEEVILGTVFEADFK